MREKPHTEGTEDTEGSPDGDGEDTESAFGGGGGRGWRGRNISKKMKKNGGELRVYHVMGHARISFVGRNKTK